MSIHSAIGATVTLGLVLVSLSNVALAQSRTQKKPSVGGKPLMQIKPSSPIGCKLVGSVKGSSGPVTAWRRLS
jgi:hypothetical protein